MQMSAIFLNNKYLLAVILLVNCLLVQPFNNIILPQNLYRVKTAAGTSRPQHCIGHFVSTNSSNVISSIKYAYSSLLSGIIARYTMPKLVLRSKKDDDTEDASPLPSNPLPPSIPLPVSLLGSSTRFVVSGSVLFYYSTTLTPTSTLLVVTSILNAVLGKLTKKALKTPRPENSPITDPTDSGMPSSHGVSLGYLSISFLLLHPPGLLPSLALVSYCGIGLYYRVLREFHTYPQVFVGYLFGASNAALFWNSPLYPYLENITREIMGERVQPWVAAGVLGAGALTIGWREIKKARRFGKKGD